MEIITRKEAILQNLLRYFTGKPCKHGHISERFVNNSGCVQCRKEKTKEYNDKRKEYRDNYYQQNKERIKERVHEYQKNNKDKIKTRNKKYREDNIEHLRAYDRERYQRDKEKRKANVRRWRKNNPHKRAAMNAKRRAAKKQATVRWANLKSISILYHEAKIREELLGIKFSVDHIIPLTHELVCGLHCEDNLQVITYSANSKKSNNFEIV